MIPLAHLLPKSLPGFSTGLPLSSSLLPVHPHLQCQITLYCSDYFTNVPLLKSTLYVYFGVSLLLKFELV